MSKFQTAGYRDHKHQLVKERPMTVEEQKRQNAAKGNQAAKSVLRLEKDVAEAIFLHRYTAKEAFSSFDENSDGKIRFEEFCNGLRKLMAPKVMTKSQEAALWARADDDKTGYIDLDEFTARFKVTVKFEAEIRQKYNISSLHIEHLESMQELLTELMRGEKGDLEELFREHKGEASHLVSKAQFKAVVKKVHDKETSEAKKHGREHKYQEGHRMGVRDSDIDKLFSLVDEVNGKIDLHQFANMLSVVNVKAPANKPKVLKHYTWKLDLGHKQTRIQTFSAVQPPPDSKVLRCQDFDKYLEDCLELCLKKSHPNLTFYHKEKTEYVDDIRRGLEGRMERVVDLIEGDDKLPVAFMVFYVSYYGDTYYTSLYHARMGFDQDCQIKSFDFKAVLTKKDYETVKNVEHPVFDDWPEHKMFDEGWIDVDENEWAQISEMTDGRNREEFLVDKFFQSRFPPIKIAKPAFTVLALQKQFRLLDGNGTGQLSHNELVEAMRNCGMAEKKAKRHAADYFKLADKNHDGMIDIQEFAEEYIRMQSFKALRSVHAQFDHADMDGNGTIEKPELEIVLADQLGPEEAKNQIDKVFKQIDRDNSGDITLRELAVWYFAMEAKQRAKHNLALIRKRRNKENKLKEAHKAKPHGR